MRYVSKSTRNFVHLSRETRNFSNHRPIRKDALSRNRHVHSIPGRGEIYYRGEVTRTSEMLDGWAVINYTTSTPLVLPVTAGPSSGFPDGKHSLDDPSFTLSLLGPRTLPPSSDDGRSNWRINFLKWIHVEAYIRSAIPGIDRETSLISIMETVRRIFLHFQTS